MWLKSRRRHDKGNFPFRINVSRRLISLHILLSSLTSIFRLHAAEKSLQLNLIRFDTRHRFHDEWHQLIDATLCAIMHRARKKSVHYRLITRRIWRTEHKILMMASGPMRCKWKFKLKLFKCTVIVLINLHWSQRVGREGENAAIKSACHKQIN